MSVTITAQEVNKLRKQTGAGMMDCKKALVEAEGDIEKAIEVLRKKGQKLANKRADREATEGAVIAMSSEDGKRGIVTRLSCETDFVSKNEDFVSFAEQIAKLALDKMPSNLEELLNLDFGGVSVGEKITEQIGVIGEKVELSAYEHIEAEEVIPYIHAGNKLGVLLGMSKAGHTQAGKDVAMQVAAMAPVGVDEDSVDQSIVNKEIEIGMEIARNEGKPEEMLERIAKGKLRKFFQENTLLNQKFVKNNKQSVAEFLKGHDGDLTVTMFKRVALG